jgi:hypothetical protein
MSLTTVHLRDEACALALDSPFLSRETRAAIQRAPENPSLLHVRDVVCTDADAKDLATFFGSLADAGEVLGLPVAAVCAEAEDAARYAML